VKFGIVFANTGPFATAEGATTLARAAEAAGFESLWTVEHVLVPSGYASPYPYSDTGRMPGREDAPIPDPLIWLTFVAAVTSSIRLATGILIASQRQPAVLAKEVATLDVLSSGRAELGVGIGWLREEFDALGVPFTERAARLDECVAAMRALWENDSASFAGKFTTFTNCVARPQPVHGTVPIHIGGHSDAAAHRAGRLGDGFFPARGDHAELTHLFEIARTSARDAGRDPDALQFTTGGRGAVGERALDEVDALAKLGVTRVVVPAQLFFKEPIEGIARYGADVIARSQ
jgi:probable F420-dependent oxidoreductase